MVMFMTKGGKKLSFKTKKKKGGKKRLSAAKRAALSRAAKRRPRHKIGKKKGQFK